MTTYNYFINISSCFFLVYLIGTVFESMYHGTLSWLNKDKGNLKEKTKDLHKIHPLMKKYFSFSKINKVKEYSTELQNFSNLKSSILENSSIVLFVVGLIPFTIHTISSFLPSFENTYIDTSLSYIVFALLYSFIKTIADIPFNYYETFNIDGRYGFNNETPKFFFFDVIKHFLFSFFVTSTIILVANFVLLKFGPFSSWKVCGFVALFIIVKMIFEVLYMNFFIKFFNKMEPLKDKKLMKKIKNLAKKAKFGNPNVFVIDESRRSTRSNAFICGFGKKNKKIVLFDNLLKKYSDDELLSILAHEMGHGKLGHLLKSRVLDVLFSLGITFAIFSMTYNVELYHAFGFNWITQENVINNSLIGFILSSMIVSSISWIIEPLFSFISRKHELQADKFSILTTNKKEPMISSLIKLTSENMGDVFPNGTVEKLTYSHPSLVNRIKEIKKTKSKK